MIKKINSKNIKLIKYYNLINYNLIYNNKAINRFKKNIYEVSNEKAGELENLKKTILNVKNCSLKKMLQIWFFLMATLKRKLCLSERDRVQMKI